MAAGQSSGPITEPSHPVSRLRGMVRCFAAKSAQGLTCTLLLWEHAFADNFGFPVTIPSSDVLI
jgi:hypothetical protein